MYKYSTETQLDNYNPAWSNIIRKLIYFLQQNLFTFNFSFNKQKELVFALQAGINPIRRFLRNLSLDICCNPGSMKKTDSFCCALIPFHHSHDAAAQYTASFPLHLPASGSTSCYPYEGVCGFLFLLSHNGDHVLS